MVRGGAGWAVPATGPYNAVITGPAPELCLWVSGTLYGRGRWFTTLAEQGSFNEALKTHCKQAAAIVETYSGEWFSKTRWEKGGDISRRDIAAFTGYATKKNDCGTEAGSRDECG
jgi:hypothetical protein